MANVILDGVTYNGVDKVSLKDADNAGQRVEFVPAPTLITKSITANGTYAASSDNADGYSSVTVNVPNKLPQVVDRTVTSIDAADLQGATSIGSSAFRDCTALNSAEIPDNVTSIKPRGFQGCISLQSLTMHNGVTSIGTYAFANCDIRSLIIPNSVTIIESTAFENNTRMSSLTIGSGVTSIGSDAFRNAAFTNFTILATTPPSLLSTSAFASRVTTIYIPNGTLSAYQTATNWSSFSSKFVELPA